MKRLINSTTILSLVLYMVPPAVQAQDFPKIILDGTEVICLPDKKTECPEGAFCVVAKKVENCEAKAAEALAEAMAASTAKTAEENAAAEATVTEEPAATDPAADNAAAKAAEEAAAAEAKAAEDAAAKAAEEAAAAEAKAAEDAAAQAAEEAAAAEAKAAEDAAAKAADEAAAAEVQATPATTAEEPLTVTVKDQVFICLPDKDVVCPEGAQCVVAKTAKKCKEKARDVLAAAEGGTTEPVTEEVPAEDAAAVAAAQAAAEAAAAEAAADPNVEVIDAPVPTEEAVQTLEAALDRSTDPESVAEAPAVEATTAVEGADVAADGSVTLTEEIPVAADATVTEEVVTDEGTRASTEEFAAAPVTVEPGKKTGLSDFEKVGLVALGALIVGAMINGNKQVVSNTGDRVVVRQPDGSYQVYKDDNALLREPGSTVRTETFRDGSTRTIVTRTDGSQIVTIRDATGRVLQRVAYDKNGRGVVLIDDTQAEEEIDVSRLPAAQPGRNEISVDEEDAALRAALASADNEEWQNRFSLRQIRNIQEVRWLAPTVDVNNITFETGSAAIQASEAKKLNKLGKFIREMIAENPRSVFLIEGHTDAVGSAASNLTLSDRRAESVAKALSEFFDVPPENLVVQGYGESELKIDTLGDERKNRRVSVRVITDLLKRGAI